MKHLFSLSLVGCSLVLWFVLTITTSFASEIHQEGYCVMRGQCGSKISFGKQLNCPYNEPAVEPDEDLRSKLVEICGAQFENSKTCCDAGQLEDLEVNIKQVETLIGSCPACWKNFLYFFCTFTCSPNQSTFVNVTSTGISKDSMTIVTSVDFFVGEDQGRGFYDSCKDIKFTATNGYVMDFIGGGAKNYHDMLIYLGTERPMGSPFQIDFPLVDPSGAMTPYNDPAKQCNDTDINYRCSCVDCESVCPILDPTPDEYPSCHVGSLDCWSFGIVMISSVILILVIIKFWYGRSQKLDNSGFVRVPVSEAEAEAELLNSGNSRHYLLNAILQEYFYQQGYICARYPWKTIFLAFLFVSLASTGWLFFAVETDPVRLWVAPNSDAATQKEFFDKSFGPFYRTQQIFITNRDPTQSVVSYENLKSLFIMEQQIRKLESYPDHLTLQDLCFHPNGDACIVQSVAGYWQSQVEKLKPDTWQDEFEMCTNTPSYCLPDFQQPLKPDMILGGFDDKNYISAKAFVLTFVLNNYVNERRIGMAEEWEKSLREYLEDVIEGKNNDINMTQLRISFSTESSLEIELNKSTNTDILTIAISYIVMFLYASFALGNTTTFPRTIIDSKFMLGISGIVIVLASVSTSVGIFSFLKIKVTLIIAEVIPFLVLAVGVDNIFILNHEFERLTLKSLGRESVEERIAKTLGRMGPSILLSALSETIAFGLGGIVTMPAVRNFALYAALAVWVDFSLQVTVFIAFLSLDAKRQEEDRLDCFPCISIEGAPGRIDREGTLQKWMRKYYAPVILNRKVKISIVAFFLGLFMVGLSLVPRVELGLGKLYFLLTLFHTNKVNRVPILKTELSNLTFNTKIFKSDQRIALPSDSYLVDYFDDLDDYFRVGPPVYFVAKNVNTSKIQGQQALCGRFSTCSQLSLANILEQERKRPKVSYIAEPSAVWIDDFLYWLNPSFEACCRIKKDSDPTELCDIYDDDCDVCFQDREPKWNITMDGFPQGEEFSRYINLWIKATPDELCPLAGKAAYGNAIRFSEDNKTVVASHFRTFHTPLKSQQDYISAHHSAKRISNLIQEKNPGVEVFPYSVFYIFFDQYEHIVQLATVILSLAFISIWLVTALLLGSMWTGFIVMCHVIMIVTDVLGVMALWNVSLNAVSLVNLVICVGIGVEFCVHIVRAFIVGGAGVDKDERAYRSIIDVGSSVFAGITMTKFFGILVLAFTRSKIFEVYYFRMYVAMVIVGALHGLVLLPVVLSLVGSNGMGSGEDFNDIFDDEEMFGGRPIRRPDNRMLVDDGGIESGESDAEEI